MDKPVPSDVGFRTKLDLWAEFQGSGLLGQFSSAELAGEFFKRFLDPVHVSISGGACVTGPG